jgi:uncharacterized ferritin-like protein (DUF455 family)
LNDGRANLTRTITAAACAILETADPARKAALSLEAAAQWRDGTIRDIGDTRPPDRPARPERPELKRPGAMPRRRGAAGRVALLHAIAHIELNAIDLAWDMIARFAATGWPRDFFDDWVRVGAEEAKHFNLLCGRLATLGASYGDFPAHDGLWQAALATAHDPLARLAIAPLVLEARGLDVTPAMIERLTAAGDDESVAILQVILNDEITHVAAGLRWFSHLANARKLDPATAFQDQVRRHYGGRIKPPFNQAGRDSAGLYADWYEPLVTD